MSIQIEKITVENLGPLNERTFDLGRCNLIYGSNETGKTFLVEFILQSLFRHSAEWSLRELTGRGKVVLSGLGEEKTDFTLETSQKIEDYWEEQDSGLPLNMARLLVVKGGELALASDSPGGVNRDVLKRVLSQEELIDRILNNILKTTQEATIENWEITGAKMGEIKQRIGLIDRKRQLSNLFDNVESQYSQGLIRELEIKKEKVQLALNQQRQAKRHHAYQLHEKIEKLKSDRRKMPDDLLGSLQNVLRDHKRVSSELTKLEKELKEKGKSAQHYSWLEQAIQTWRNQGLGKVQKTSVAILIVGGLSLLAGFGIGLFGLVAVALSIFSLSPGGLFFLSILSLFFFVLGLGLIGFYLQRLLRWTKSATETEERQSIQQGYKERFGESLSSLTDLKTRLEILRKDNFAVSDLRNRIEEIQREKSEYVDEINNHFQALTGKIIEKSMWQSTLQKIQKQNHEIDNEIQELSIRLEKLDIDKSDFRIQTVDFQYSKEKIEELEEELAELVDNLLDAQNDLKSLKQLICNETGDEINTPWPRIIKCLRERREDVNRDYRQITAEILAKIGISQVLEEIRTQEDEKIRRDLKTEEVGSVLSMITGCYESLDLADDQLIVSGDYGNYHLSDLSTGAREQVQLALRMGFATRLAGNQPLFLILDDAFQHSDWERRERLCKQVIQLAKSGWQVTYLTMDDHIRDLFCERGKEAFGDQFRYEVIDM